tara:strand:+ start:198 stop:362 length:165 start_codon:yes stop_codon:yes gene_type:complete
LNPESPSHSINYINVVNKYRPEYAEKTNGRWAMLGFIAAFGAYATTGQIIPGIF